jgi:hypothetical protein
VLSLLLFFWAEDPYGPAHSMPARLLIVAVLNRLSPSKAAVAAALGGIP